jgi:multidrug resistance efflux pump
VFAVNLVTAETSAEVPVLDTFGEIASRRTLEIRAAVSGRIIALAPNFEDGAAVAQDDVLISIDPADLQSEVDRLRADLADAEAEVRDADRGLELALLDEAAAKQQATLRAQAFARQADLAGRGVGSAASVETAELAAAAADAVVITRRLAVTQAEARIDQAATRLERARIALADATRDLEDTTIRAPFDGLLSDTAVVEGGLIVVNERLADLVDPNDLEVGFRLSTAQYSRLLDQEGDILPLPVTVELDASGVDLTARGFVSRVNVATGDLQTGRLIFARLDNPRGFRPGDFVAVRVEEPALSGVVRLPATAYDTAGHVLVLSQDDRLETLEVELVRRQGDDVLVRGAGLAGREVVRELSPLLGAGIAVRPIRTNASEASNATPLMLRLTEERRARLIAFVQEDERFPDTEKTQILSQLSGRDVPRQIVTRLESRMGG